MNIPLEEQSQKEKSTPKTEMDFTDIVKVWFYMIDFIVRIASRNSAPIISTSW